MSTLPQKENCQCYYFGAAGVSSRTSFGNKSLQIQCCFIPDALKYEVLINILYSIRSATDSQYRSILVSVTLAS